MNICCLLFNCYLLVNPADNEHLLPVVQLLSLSKSCDNEHLLPVVQLLSLSKSCDDEHIVACCSIVIS